MHTGTHTDSYKLELETPTQLEIFLLMLAIRSPTHLPACHGVGYDVQFATATVDYDAEAEAMRFNELTASLSLRDKFSAANVIIGAYRRYVHRRKIRRYVRQFYKEVRGKLVSRSAAVMRGQVVLRQQATQARLGALMPAFSESLICVQAAAHRLLCDSAQMRRLETIAWQRRHEDETVRATLKYRVRQKLKVPIILPSDSEEVKRAKQRVVPMWIEAANKAIRAPPLQVRLGVSLM